METGTLIVITTLATAGVACLIFWLIQTLQKPPTLSASSEGEIVLGKIKDSINLLKLDKSDQLSHGSVFGMSGSGKSRMLESIFLQRFNVGKDGGFGTVIIEPHHDLSYDTLSYLVSVEYFRDQDAFDNLIYVDWGNGDYIPFNILVKNGRSTYTTTKNALDAMIRVWPELTQAPAFQRLFEAAVATLVENSLPITFLHQLISDKPFRDLCLTKVSDPVIHQAFASFEELGRDAPQEKASLERRAFALSFDPITRYTLGQPTNSLNFREIMDSGKSFIINLGHIGDVESRKLIGSIILLQIEQAAISRADIDEEDRKPFTLIIDEWPAFAAHGPTIGEILSQCRKYQLYLYLSAQSLAQVDSKRLTGALENCRIKVAFGLGRESAEVQSREIGDIDVMTIKEEAPTSNQHNQYLSVADQFESWTKAFQQLPPRFAYVKKGQEKAVCIQTTTMPRVEVDKSEREQVLMTYRRKYQCTQAEAEAAIANLTMPGTSSNQGANFQANGSAGPYQQPSYKRGYQTP